MNNTSPLSKFLKARQWCKEIHDKIDDATGKVLKISGDNARRFDEGVALRFLGAATVTTVMSATLAHISSTFSVKGLIGVNLMANPIFAVAMGLMDIKRADQTRTMLGNNLS